jgi:hypothetical protein
METANLSSNGHSADVRINLCINGQVLPIAQLGPGFFILRKTIDHPPTHAEIDLSIDGNKHRWSVYLPEGLSTGQEETRTCPPIDNGSKVA